MQWAFAGCDPWRKRWSCRTTLALLGAAIALVLCLGVQNGVMGAINVQRVEATGQTIEELPDAHAVWHSMYMGLSYPQPLTGAASTFGVTWSDEYGWAKAREIDPAELIYGSVVKDVVASGFVESLYAR